MTQEIPVARAGELTHRYREHRVFEELGFDLGPGITGLVGVNGAGKSTLLHILAGSLAPTSGSFMLAGLPERPERARRSAAGRTTGLMPQQLVLPGRLRVEDYLLYMAWQRALPRKERRSRVKEVLEQVELGRHAQARVGELSGGMQRRLLLAQAVLGSPRLLLLDEPTEALDPEHRLTIRDLIRDQAGDDRAVVLSSHLMEDVAQIADRVLMLDAGRLVFDGTPTQLREIGEPLVTDDTRISAYEAAFLSLRADRVR
jgi:ABC-2 type transport system ATP-binding protein